MPRIWFRTFGIQIWSVAGLTFLAMLVGCATEAERISRNIAKAQEAEREQITSNFAKAQEAERNGDAAMAFQIYRVLATEHEQAAAMRKLGQAYENGQGVDIDQKEAVAWYEKAASQGDAEAQYWLGQQYASGALLPRDAKVAKYWITRAAEQGHPSTRQSMNKFEAQATDNSGEGKSILSAVGDGFISFLKIFADITSAVAPVLLQQQQLRSGGSNYLATPSYGGSSSGTSSTYRPGGSYEAGKFGDINFPQCKNSTKVRGTDVDVCLDPPPPPKPVAAPTPYVPSHNRVAQ